MPKYVVDPPPIQHVPVLSSEKDKTEKKNLLFPVRRIYCVAKNYADHVREMGGDPDREDPCFFTKPADAIVQNKAYIPYPSATSDLHYEVELVVAIGGPTATEKLAKKNDGVLSVVKPIPESKAMEYVYGYSVGIDLTRRDLQAQAKAQGRPWDSAKAFDHSAPIAPITKKKDAEFSFDMVENAETAKKEYVDNKNKIWLTVNGELQQSGTLNQMIWNVPEVIAHLSKQFELRPGDLIFTGTPAGVGPLQTGDKVVGGIDGLGANVHFTIA